MLPCLALLLNKPVPKPVLEPFPVFALVPKLARPEFGFFNGVAPYSSSVLVESVLLAFSAAAVVSRGSGSALSERIAIA
jgi:hypothetical protein